MRILKYVLRRLLLLIPVLFAVTLITFAASRAVPADPLTMRFGVDAFATIGPERLERLRAELGLDRPLPIQYVNYVTDLLKGDLGVSFQRSTPVAEDIVRFLPATVELATLGIIVGTTLGIPLGLIAAATRNRIPDHGTRLISLVGMAAPVFWVALLLQLLFYSYLDILPAGGRLDQSIAIFDPLRTLTGMYVVDSILQARWDAALSAARHLVLPGFAISLYPLALVTRMTRASVIEVLGSDYMRTAASLGLRPLTRWWYALKNALKPILTVVGLSVGNVLGGAVLVETIFDFPGMGLYAYNGILGADYPVIMGVAVVAVVVYLFANLVVDILYTVIDPRIVY